MNTLSWVVLFSMWKGFELKFVVNVVIDYWFVKEEPIIYLVDSQVELMHASKDGVFRCFVHSDGVGVRLLLGNPVELVSPCNLCVDVGVGGVSELVDIVPEARYRARALAVRDIAALAVKEPTHWDVPNELVELHLVVTLKILALHA